MFSHSFQQEYVEEGECNKIQRCQRCNKVEKFGIGHQYGGWIKEKPCHFYRICMRCNATDQKVEHDFEDCNSCWGQGGDIISLEWGGWESCKACGGSGKGKCRKCGYVNEK